MSRPRRASSHDEGMSLDEYALEISCFNACTITDWDG